MSTIDPSIFFNGVNLMPSILLVNVLFYKYSVAIILYQNLKLIASKLNLSTSPPINNDRATLDSIHYYMVSF